MSHPHVIFLKENIFCQEFRDPLLYTNTYNVNSLYYQYDKLHLNANLFILLFKLRMRLFYLLNIFIHKCDIRYLLTNCMI